MSRNPSRRKFLQQIAAGALTAPILMSQLGKTLLAQKTIEKKPLIWLHGQSSAIHQTGAWTLPGFSDFVREHFKEYSINTFFSLSVEDQPIVLLDGYFFQEMREMQMDHLVDLLKKARVILLIGNEASYGSQTPPGFLNVETDLLSKTTTPYIRIPGVPASARHILGTLNHLILYGMPEIDEFKRPLMFFSTRICDRCEYRSDFESGNFAKFFGEKEGCLYLLGCKGPLTKNSCPHDKWNHTDTWCVSAGSPCSGCSDPDFPNHTGLGLYGQLSANTAGINSPLINYVEEAAVGAMGLAVSGILLHSISKKKPTPVELKTDHLYKGEEQ